MSFYPSQTRQTSHRGRAAGRDGGTGRYGDDAVSRRRAAQARDHVAEGEEAIGQWRTHDGARG